MCLPWDMERNVPGIWLPSCCTKGAYHPHGLKSLSHWEVVCTQCFCACVCAYVHNVFMDVMKQPSSEIPLFFLFISQSSSVRPGLKLKDPVVLKAWG